MTSLSNSDFKKYIPVFPVTESRDATCVEHGEYDDHLLDTPAGEVWSGCPACIAVEISFAPKRMIEQKAKEHKKDLVSRIFKQAAIPERFADKTLANYKPQNNKAFNILRSAQKYVTNWVDNKRIGKCLTFYGNPGNGKTHLSVGIAQQVILAGDTALYVRQIDLGRIVRETFKAKEGKSEREVIQRFAEPDLMIIDEMGHDQNGNHDRVVLHEVLNVRYDKCKPTIIITNLSISRINQYIDIKTRDRLLECGSSPVLFDWESYRSKAGV